MPKLKQRDVCLVDEKGRESVSDLFKGVCDYCGRESLPTTMSMCNECAEKEERRA